MGAISWQMVEEIVSNGVDFGIAMRMRRNALDAEEMSGALADLAKARGERITALDDLVRIQGERIAQLELHLATEKAHAQGLDAQVEAFATQYSGSSLLADSGQRYQKSGNIKSRIRLAYEAAFDATFRKLMPSIDPKSRRAY